MIDIDWTLGALLINFLVLVFLLNVVLFRPIRKALKERQARLDAQAADINLMETQGQGLDSEIKDKLTAAEILTLRFCFIFQRKVTASTSLTICAIRRADCWAYRVFQTIFATCASKRLSAMSARNLRWISSTTG